MTRKQYTRSTMHEGDHTETRQDDQTVRHERNRARYGCLTCHPTGLVPLASGKFFLLAMCMLIFSDAFNIGTLSGALTSLETRYELTASQLGLIESMYEAGNLIFVIFIVHFAGREEHRRPLWIGLGALTMAVGTAIAYSPQFFFSSYEPDWRSHPTNQSTGPLTCGSDWMEPRCELEEAHAFRQESHMAYVVVLCGEILVGIGWTPVMPLAISYIDDNVNTKTSAMYIGIIQSMFGVGTIVGFLVSAAVTSYWVDFYRVDIDTIQLVPGDKPWVGAWWLGLAITSALYFMSSLPFFGFPRRLRTQSTSSCADADHFMLESQTTDDPDQEEEVLEPENTSKNVFSLSVLPSLLWRLLCNPIYLWLNISSFSETAVIAGLVTFFPKYLETQFGLSPPEANFYMAVIPVPAVAVGSLLGGYLLKKLSLKAEGAMKLALVCSIISLIGQLVLLGIGCDDTGLAGVDVAYPDDRKIDWFSVNLTSKCNVDCGCNSDDPEIICGVDGITYFSACHAGCKEYNDGTFFNCSCVQDPTNQMAGSAQHEACPISDCHMLAPCLVAIFIIALSSSCEKVPQLMVMMRCVKKSDKSLALGLRHVFTRVFGNIPAPLYYGLAIDATCRLWQQFCGERGECWAYNLPDFRYTFMGITVGLKVISVASYVMAWALLIKRSGDPGKALSTDDSKRVDEGVTTSEYRRLTKNGAGGGAVPECTGEESLDGDEGKADVLKVTSV